MNTVIISHSFMFLPDNKSTTIYSILLYLPNILNFDNSMT